MEPIDDQRSELQRAGEAFRDLIRPDFENLSRAITDIKVELRRINRPKSHRPDPRKQVIARLIHDNPKMSNLAICRAMDERQEKFPKLAPLPSWNWRLWEEAYLHVPARVHVYINAIRRGRY